MILLDHNTPVTVDLEYNGYKSKLSMTRGGITISADMTTEEQQELGELFLGEKLDSIDELETKNDDLSEEIEKLKTQLRIEEDKNDKLEEKIGELETELEELTNA